MTEYVIQNIENVDESSNEVINRHTINRNFLKLLENDKALDQLMSSQLINQNNIIPYFKGKTYQKNDLIWFKDKNSNGEPMLYILRSLIDNNSNIPTKSVIDKIESFEDSCWKDEYEYGSIIENSIKSYLSYVFDRNIEANHILNAEYHKFKQLTDSQAYDNTKLLLRDLTNIQADRTINHFPYETIMLKPDNVVQNGYYRKWNCGLLEYDIIFKLGFQGQTIDINDSTYEVIEANNLSSYDEDCQYSSDDSDIFNQPGTISVQINNTYQIGLNKYCNAYAGMINFSEMFKDNDYMIFSGDIACQERNTKSPTIDSGANSLVYVNKTTESVTPLLIVYPSDTAEIFGLVANTFSCRIVGRWK